MIQYSQTDCLWILSVVTKFQQCKLLLHIWFQIISIYMQFTILYYKIKLVLSSITNCFTFFRKVQHNVHCSSAEVTQFQAPLPWEHICLDSGSGVDAPLTAFQCLIPDLWHAQCPLAERSNPKALASIFSNGFTDVRWSFDGWRLSEQSWRSEALQALLGIGMHMCL